MTFYQINIDDEEQNKKIRLVSARHNCTYKEAIIKIIDAFVFQLDDGKNKKLTSIN